MGHLLVRVEVQLRDELAHLVRPLAVLVGSAETQDWPARLTGRAEALTSALLSADDDEATDAAVGVLAALWPRSDPDSAWWRTPLGQVLARSLGSEDAEAVRVTVAALMLGVEVEEVLVLVRDGKLDEHLDGGVWMSSVRRQMMGLVT